MLRQVALDMLRALDARSQIASLGAVRPDFDLAAAYQVTAQVCALRQARGERPVGRKLGFTNRNIWEEYQVFGPIWGYMYDTTVRFIDPQAASFELASVVEPRIEPEITLSFSRAPEPGMDEGAILECIDWVAHGFEIVQSLYPGWKFTAPDTVAAFGLHGALLLGPRFPVTSANRAQWLDYLTNFQVRLLCNGRALDHGVAANVLGGPLSAVRNCIDVLSHDADNRQITAGEFVTTGTITRAFPISRGEEWQSEFFNSPFEGIRLLIV